tara:strand:+ start:3064 stop:3249 length:186 start_codon:yes stop_codon:yes gene_type:complete
MHTTTVNVITGEIAQVPFTAEQQAEWDAMKAAYVAPTPATPTKEQLLAELQVLTAKINALG